MQRAPPVPRHVDRRVERKPRVAGGAATCFRQHLGPERLLAAAIVHHEVVLVEQSRHAELGTVHGGAVEHQRAPGERAIGDGEIERAPRGRQAQVDDLVVPQDVVRHGVGDVVHDEAHHAVVGAQELPKVGVVRPHQSRLAERRDPVPADAAVEQEVPVQLTGTGLQRGIVPWAPLAQGIATAAHSEQQ